MACDNLAAKAEFLILNPCLARNKVACLVCTRLLLWVCVEHYIWAWCRNCAFEPSVALTCHNSCVVPLAVRLFTAVCVSIATNIWPVVWVIVVNNRTCAVKCLINKVNGCVSTVKCTCRVGRILVCVKLIALNWCERNAVAVAFTILCWNGVLNWLTVFVNIVYRNIAWTNTTGAVNISYIVVLSACNSTRSYTLSILESIVIKNGCVGVSTICCAVSIFCCWCL